MAIRKFAGSLTVAALIAIAVAAQAESFERVQNGLFAIDQDVGNGNFSPWTVKDLTGIDTLRGRATILRLGVDREWAPGFQVVLKSGEETLRLKFVAATGRATMIDTYMARTGGSGDREVKLNSRVRVGTPFDIQAHWKPDGSVELLVRTSTGEERVTAKMGAAPTSLEILASTGEWAIDPIELGRLKP